MFCTKCGNQIPDNSFFCTNCGAPVAAAPEPAVTSVPGVTPLTVPEPAVTPMPEVTSVTAPEPAVTSAPEVTPVAAPEPAVTPVPEPAVTPAPEVMPVAAPEPAVTPAPEAVETPAPAPGPYDVPDITIMAAKWIPDNGSLPPVMPVEQPKKKKTGLIIALCSVVAVIALLVGTVLFFTVRYSSKVEELSALKESSLINGRFGEYVDLLARAEDAEGIFNLFSSFAVGEEIDTFLESVNARKEALPEEVLGWYNKITGLNKKYSVDKWDYQIQNLGNDIGNSIEQEDYESLVYLETKCELLYDEIIDTNRKYMDELLEIRNRLVDMRSSYASYSAYKDEVDNFIEQANAYLAGDDTREVRYYLTDGYQYIKQIEDANRPYEELEERKAYYDDLFKEVDISDNERYHNILVEYSNAMFLGSDASQLSDIVSEYAAFYEDTHEANTQEYEMLLTKIGNFDLSRLSEEELATFNETREAMQKAFDEDRMATALKNARTCMTYVDQYTLNILECTRFITLATRLASEYFLANDFVYSTEISEDRMNFICRYVLTEDQIKELKETLGWGNPDEKTAGELSAYEDEYGYNPWSCGFSRSECEELAYFITGKKHYYYKEIKDAGNDELYYENKGMIKKGDISVAENDDGTLALSYPVQIKYDGIIYSAVITVTAGYNPDSFFDNYSVTGIEISDIEEVNYEKVYLDALNELYDYESDQYGDDSFSRQMSFFFVDDDYIPEIYVSSVFGYAHAYLISYVDNDNYNISLLESGDGFSEYIPGAGVVRICDGRQGYYSDIVISLMGSGETRTDFSGEYYYVDLDSDEMNYKVNYPEEIDDADPDVYYAYLDEFYTAKGESSYLYGDYTYDFMVKSLSDYVPY